MSPSPDRSWDETLADIRELPASVFLFGAAQPQHVGVRVTLPDGSTAIGTTAVMSVLGPPTKAEEASARARAASAIRAGVERGHPCDE